MPRAGPTLTSIVGELRDAVDELRFPAPVSHVYNPLRYAWRPHLIYLRRYGTAPKQTLFLGMNPGPFGMAQTGVPFGEVDAVRRWLQIEAPVQTPAIEHPKRPVLGFACRRSEVSGQRFWGWAERRWGTAARFFRDHWVHNYCPLLFMEATGRNITPDKLPATAARPLTEICDDALRRVARSLQVHTVVGIGAFAEKCARRALGSGAVRIHRIPHPSPASPAANRGWAAAADAAYVALG